MILKVLLFFLIGFGTLPRSAQASVLGGECSSLLTSTQRNESFRGWVRVSSERDIFVLVEIPKKVKKQPVLLVHGLLDSHRRFDSITKQLLKKGHPVIRVDVYGFGQSLIREVQRNKGRLEFLKSLPFQLNSQDLRDILLWQDQKYQWGAVTVVGHSMGGGLLAQAVAHKSLDGVVDRMVLLSPYVYRLDQYHLESQLWNPFSSLGGFASDLFGRLQSDLVEKYLATHDPLLDRFFLNSHMRERFLEHLNEMSQSQNEEFKKILVVSAIATVKGLRDLNVLDLVPRFSPSLRVDLVAASDDDLVPLGQLKKLGLRLLERKRTLGLDGEMYLLEASHMLPSDDPDSIAELISN